MAKKRVFISFDFDNDARMKDLLVGQAKHEGSPFDFADWPSKEHLTGDWRAKIKAKMAYVDVVCVLCGKNMATATGVSHEINIARETGTPYFLLAAYSDSYSRPTAAVAGDKVYNWTWPNLKNLVGGAR
ncbi:TIR domain-containing protein [Pseudorhodoferax sp. Leaf265]|uniref:TIR domain-containing protein n=1 Tax=Pseudorhodoferax sp. Leaf265 TaxID=1736315 RepID=UPI0009E9E02D|nr:TIR domain-containing protein [Pseudorhodoferax sp. Leaf265]